MNTYRLLKFLHLASVALWMGGAFSLSVLILRVARGRDRTALASVLRHAGFYGRAVVGPTSLLTLVSGMAMLGVLGLRPSELWVQWGLAGILLHFPILGATLIRRATTHLEALAGAPGTGDAVIAAARRRLGLLNALYLSVLLSVVGAMVLKPSL